MIIKNIHIEPNNIIHEISKYLILHICDNNAKMAIQKWSYLTNHKSDLDNT